MKAAVIEQFGAEDELRYGDARDPMPGADEILVRVRGAAVNRGDLGRRAGSYAGGGELPLIVGWDIAGTVRALGVQLGSGAPPAGPMAHVRATLGRQRPEVFADEGEEPAADAPSVAWSVEARDRLGRIPSFIRERVQQAAELMRASAGCRR